MRWLTHATSNEEESARIAWSPPCCLAPLLICVAAQGCSASPAHSPPAEPPLALAPQPPAPAETSAAHELACPGVIANTVVSSVRTKRGVNVLFSTQSIPHRNDLLKRAHDLAELYNSVYGANGERTSWAKAERSPQGSRVEFAIFSEADLDPKIEPIPEAYEDELEGLRDRIESYVIRMQSGDEACPLTRDLISLGARRPANVAQGS